jgi:hypothetical protein
VSENREVRRIFGPKGEDKQEDEGNCIQQIFLG